ncbi:efflux RND transporter periplasmic adaptor subunit [Virgibacillus xinjiangensis]|uniref:Efflux RND transporter periplasmic adaptor subunit n=1 Tax=Virgibacillus xinjiangensis TaxID=393090 RepID=A0ABV7CX07_9BACI
MIKKWILLLVAGLFAGVNILMVAMDEEGKVEQKAYISEWSKAMEKNMTTLLHKPGVLQPAEEWMVYYDESLGSFQEFLVEEGTLVQQGEPLFAYEAENYTEVETELSRKAETLRGEITAIEEAIIQMEQYQVSSSQSEAASPPPFESETTFTESPTQPVEPAEAELMKEEYLIEKEKELSQKNAELDSVEASLDELQETGNSVVVESPYEGRVTSISETLTDPVVVIENIQLQAEGELSEEERNKIEAGMPVEVQVKTTDTVIEGEITQVSDSPKSAHVDGDSIYPFQVSLSEYTEEEGLLPGYHTNLAITLEESTGATALYEGAVYNGAVWKMTGEGTLQKQEVETGIYEDFIYEIKSGIGVGDWAAESPTGQFRQGAVFITPLQLQEVPWKNLFADEEWKKNVVNGIVAR